VEAALTDVDLQGSGADHVVLHARVHREAQAGVREFALRTSAQRESAPLPLRPAVVRQQTRPRRLRCMAKWRVGRSWGGRARALTCTSAIFEVFSSRSARPRLTNACQARLKPSAAPSMMP